MSGFSVRRQDIGNTRRQDMGNTWLMPVGAVGNAFYAFSKDLVGAFLASTGPAASRGRSSDRLRPDCNEQLAHVHMAIPDEDAPLERDTGDPFTAERFADKQAMSVIRNLPAGVHAMDVAARRVLPDAGLGPIPATTRAEMQRRRFLPERGVRTHLVVFGAERGQGLREALRSTRDPPPPQALAQRPMKSLDLALRLRMADAPVPQPNALLQQKHAQRRQPRVIARCPPGTAVVHQHRARARHTVRSTRPAHPGRAAGAASPTRTARPRTDCDRPRCSSG